MDFAAPIISLGYALGRIACFLEGCCYGKICDWPWAYTFGQIDFATGQFSFATRHPTQLYASLLEFSILFLVLYLEKIKRFAARPGMLFMVWLALHAFNRILVEIFRDDDRGAMLAGMSISTLISFCLVLVAGFYFFKNRKYS